MFSKAHMLAILSNPRHLFKFREFLNAERPGSMPVLMYYLSACKALKVIEYANAVAQLLMPLSEIESSDEHIPNARNPKLEQQAQNALHALVIDELPASSRQTAFHWFQMLLKGKLKALFHRNSKAQPMHWLKFFV